MTDVEQMMDFEILCLLSYLNRPSFTHVHTYYVDKTTPKEEKTKKTKRKIIIYIYHVWNNSHGARTINTLLCVPSSTWTWQSAHNTHWYRHRHTCSKLCVFMRAYWGQPWFEHRTYVLYELINLWNQIHVLCHLSSSHLSFSLIFVAFGSIARLSSISFSLNRI